MSDGMGREFVYLSSHATNRYFIPNWGNVLHGGGDMKSFYQILALKIDVTRNSYLHIGYNLREFHEPNYLMLGIGYRFNNKRPKLF